MKPFKTLDEQVSLLRRRGLIINDENSAKNYLLENSYYNVINVHSKFFMKDDRYIEGATFKEIIKTHIYDTEVKSLILKNIISAEKHIKGIIAYRFSEVYKDEPYAYLKTNNYNGDDLLGISTTISKLSKIIRSKSSEKKSNPIKHYYNQHGNIPVWVILPFCTLGEITYFYRHLDHKLRNRIAKDFSNYVLQNTNSSVILEPKFIDGLLKNLTDIRNIAAHNNRLFHFKCRNTLTNHDTIYSDLTERKPELNSVFYTLVLLRCFLTKNEYDNFKNALRNRSRSLNNSISSISAYEIISSLGFPREWLSKK
ncbi:Abi family protein [Ignavigranum ruoffiae]|uniref:Abi family protein n=1 Tax=Ignavigranum ruoffiae TaxID=89093 RepID=UPI002062D9AD|nr:Abi family protein [Ignavigranum ruoffiae]UPQ86054.1 Abi family protein [Ignavigranum ruoffiae]